MKAIIADYLKTLQYTKKIDSIAFANWQERFKDLVSRNKKFDTIYSFLREEAA